MLDIFYYVETEKLQDILNLGIKLSDNFERNILNQNYIVGLLNPKDDYEKYFSSKYTCIQLNIPTDNIKVADKSVFNTNYYVDTIVDFNNYLLGEYLMPEVLIPSSILPEKISEYDYIIGSPILYDNSKELYYSNLIAKLSASLSNSHSIICDALLKEYAKENSWKTTESSDINIYINDNDKKIYTTEK